MIPLIFPSFALVVLIGIWLADRRRKSALFRLNVRRAGNTLNRRHQVRREILFKIGRTICRR